MGSKVFGGSETVKDPISAEKNGRQTHPISERPDVHEIIQINLPDSRRISREIVELYKNGRSLDDIAGTVGRSKARVRAILHRKGISTRPPIDETKYTAWRKSRKTIATPPFGFTYYFGELVIEPREHEILLLIERLANEGMNPNAIAEHLNAKGFRPRRASKWNRNSIVVILKRQRSKSD